MDITNVILPLLGGLGIGSLLNTVVQCLLSSRKECTERQYNETKAAYFGLLEAIYDVSIHSSKATLNKYDLCKLKCELVGSREVIDNAERLTQQSPNDEEHGKIFANLISEMRKDMQQFYGKNFKK